MDNTLLQLICVLVQDIALILLVILFIKSEKSNYTNRKKDIKVIFSLSLVSISVNLLFQKWDLVMANILIFLFLLFWFGIVRRRHPL